MKKQFLATMLIASGALSASMSELGWAVRDGKNDRVELLITSGANVNEKYCYGDTPLHHAALCNRTEIAKFLLKRGANVHEKDYKDETPLHFAAILGMTEVALVLLEHGADFKAQNKDKKTPLDLAIQNKRPKTVQLLAHWSERKLQE